MVCFMVGGRFGVGGWWLGLLRFSCCRGNTGDFPKVSLMLGSGLRKNRRCHPVEASAMLPKEAWH